MHDSRSVLDTCYRHDEAGNANCVGSVLEVTNANGPGLPHMGAVRRRAPYTVRRLPALWKSRLAKAVESYLALRRAAGYALRCQGSLLGTFATFSDTKGKHYVCSEIAIEWAGSVPSIFQRARRLDEVIRFSRYIRAED